MNGHEAAEPAAVAVVAMTVFEQVAEGAMSPARALQSLLGSPGPACGVVAGGTAAVSRQPPAGPVRLDGERREPERAGETLEQVMAELEGLVGLAPVKRAVAELRAYLEVRRHRQACGLACEPMVLHMAFKGNPGTGKTTVARIVGRLLQALGVLAKGHLVEVERADLVGEYVGHTAQRTREQVRRALGGVLFIDEAYSLARGGEKDFGREAVDTLVKAMEDHRHELVTIMAGYRDEMERFLRTNPGLRSRIPLVLDFPDYTVAELLQIADHMLRARDYRLSPEARQRLACVLVEHRLASWDNFGNARVVRNVLEAAIRRQALRLQALPQPTREELMLLQARDIPDPWETLTGLAGEGLPQA